MARKHKLANGTVWNITTEAEAKKRLAKGKPGYAMEWLESYKPRGAAGGNWSPAVGDFVRIQIARITTLNGDAVRRYTRVLAHLAGFCHSEGTALDVEKVLDPDTVEQFINRVITKSPGSSTATYRSDLRRLGPALTTRAPWEPPDTRIARPQLAAPYDAKQAAKIVKAIDRQLTPQQRRSARAVIAQGLGAGLDGRWNTKTDCEAVKGRGPVRIRVPDPAARTVVVRSAFEKDILDLAANRDGTLTGSPWTRNLSNELAARIVVGGETGVVKGARLRSTWIVAHLEAGTPLNVLIAAAGVQTIGSIGDLIKYMTPATAGRIAQLLRDA